MQDFHSGGTVCSPTRATVLTGRNHFRDCVNYVYGCSDMTECVPNFEFAAETFTVPMAVRKANRGYTSWFGGVSSFASCHSRVNIRGYRGETLPRHYACFAARVRQCGSCAEMAFGFFLQRLGEPWR